MKTGLAVIIAFVALFAIAGCDGGGEASKNAFVQGDGAAEDPGTNPFFVPGEEGADGTEGADIEDGGSKKEVKDPPADDDDTDELSCAPAYGGSQLADGYISVEYKHSIAVSGGSMNYSVSGITLPEGLNLKEVKYYTRGEKKSKHYLISGTPAEAWDKKITINVQDTETKEEMTCKLSLQIHKQISLKHAVVSPGNDGEQDTWDDVHAFTIEDDEEGADYFKGFKFAWDDDPNNKIYPKACATTVKPEKNFKFETCPTSNDTSAPPAKIGYFWFMKQHKKSGTLKVTFYVVKGGEGGKSLVKLTVPIYFPGAQQTVPNPSTEPTPENGGTGSKTNLPTEHVDDIKVLILTGVVQGYGYEDEYDEASKTFVNTHALDNSWFSMLFFTKLNGSLKSKEGQFGGSEEYNYDKIIDAAAGEVYSTVDRCNNNGSDSSYGSICDDDDVDYSQYDDDACFNEPAEVAHGDSTDVTKIKEIGLLWHNDNSNFKFDIRAIIFYTDRRFAIYIDESPWGNAVFPAMCDGWLNFTWKFDILTDLPGMQKAPDGSIWYERANPYNTPKDDPAIKEFIDKINNQLAGEGKGDEDQGDE